MAAVRLVLFSTRTAALVFAVLSACSMLCQSSRDESTYEGIEHIPLNASNLSQVSLHRSTNNSSRSFLEVATRSFKRFSEKSRVRMKREALESLLQTETRAFLEQFSKPVEVGKDEDVATPMDIEKLCSEMREDMDVYDCQKLVASLRSKHKMNEKRKLLAKQQGEEVKEVVAQDWDPDRDPISMTDYCRVQNGITDEEANEVVYKCVRQLMWLKEVALRVGKLSWKANNDYAGQYAKLRNHLSDLSNKDAYTIAFAADQSYVHKKLQKHLKGILKKVAEFPQEAIY